MILHGPRVIFSKKSHFAKMLKNYRHIFLNCVRAVQVRNNSFTMSCCKLSLLQTFWYQIELPKSFGSRDRILPKYGHGRGRFGGFFANFLNLVRPPNSFGMMSSNQTPSEFSCKGLSANSIQAISQSKMTLFLQKTMFWY